MTNLNSLKLIFYTKPKAEDILFCNYTDNVIAVEVYVFISG